ncbi:signal peptidase I [Saccharophagus degradans]|uniref:signal peptidase I n=1 Tax=Saccharophagus degradans TaxID=86304 RepID=UPI001C09427D|nr:signal peptidase I [Saccharophagus degradans]MBU2985706.1 signal peptidase I [Saccharophagus degradans]
MLTAFKILIGIVLPGSTAMFGGKNWAGKGIPLVGLGWILLICLTRLITNSYGLYILLGGLLLIHLASFTMNLKHLIAADNQVIRYANQFFFLLTLNVSIAIICLIYKPLLLGFNIYHIPSTSMKPTLIPGDIILVDTWYYHFKALEKNDIVVFKLQSESPTMVKRVIDISKARNNKKTSVFLEGDNKRQSIDSRKFGWIDQNNIIGKYKSVLINIRSK